MLNIFMKRNFIAVSNNSSIIQNIRVRNTKPLTMESEFNTRRKCHDCDDCDDEGKFVEELGYMLCRNNSCYASWLGLDKEGAYCKLCEEDFADCAARKCGFVKVAVGPVGKRRIVHVCEDCVATMEHGHIFKED